MAIIINVDVMLARRKMSVTELSRQLDISMANVSILKNGRAKAVKLDTLNKLCRILECQPGDLLEYRPDGACGEDLGSGRNLVEEDVDSGRNSMEEDVDSGRNSMEEDVDSGRDFIGEDMDSGNSFGEEGAENG